MTLGHGFKVPGVFIFPSVWTKHLLGCVYTFKSEVLKSSQCMGTTYPVISFNGRGVNQLFFRAPEMSAFVELFLLGSFLLRRLARDTRQ